MIQFNIPFKSKGQFENLSQLFEGEKFSGDGFFTGKCHQWLDKTYSSKKSLLTTSCTHSLEMAAILANVEAGDEVIMSSYTFVSTANAFVLRGAKIVFVDIRPDTMNIDESLIEAAITDKTKVIVPVHYAGVSCNMNRITEIALKYNLLVIEDAAQCIGSTYNSKPVGTMGDISCFSFHETKNIHSGEGGAVLINDEKFAERAEIIREKGTNRSRFIRGQVDKYTWVDLGSSYLPSELNAAVLSSQFDNEKDITNKRLKLWDVYYDNLKELKDNGILDLPIIPDDCQHNGHMFFIKLKNIEERQEIINHLKVNGISSVFHYIPLHSAEAGLNFGRFHGMDNYTTVESEKLLRLPMYYSLEIEQVEFICSTIKKFYS
jgi:dTDP-4-amino-4,6-dideoxygalactose transaminase